MHEIEGASESDSELDSALIFHYFNRKFATDIIICSKL